MDDTNGRDNAIQTNSTGLTLSEQAPINAIATVELDQTIRNVWQALFDYEDVQEAFVRSVRNAAEGRTEAEFRELLEELGVPDRSWHGSYQSLVVRIARGDSTAVWEFLAQTRQMGKGQYSTDETLSTARLLTFNDRSKTVEFKMDYEEFDELDRDEREEVCSLISVLSKSFDVWINASRYTRVWLRNSHRDNLPSVSDWSLANRRGSHVEDALEAIAPDSGPVRLARTLAEEPGEVLTYSELRADLDIARSTVRGWVSKLSEFGLVESYGSTSNKKAALLPAGGEFLNELDDEFGRQASLNEGVLTPQNEEDRRREQLTAKDGGDSRDFYRTAYMKPSHHAAVVACAGNNGGVGFATDDISAYSSKERLVSYDSDKDEVALSTHATNPLDYTVSKAVAFSDPKLLDEALPVDRLEGVIETIPEVVLREGRCLGGCSDRRLENPEELRDYWVEWGEDLEDYTRKLKKGEYDDRNRFVGNILCSAHGLIGSIAHAADCAGIDIYREIRVPKDIQPEQLATSIAHSIKVQSEFENSNAYRQLFEQREDKRQIAYTPTIDPTDAVGGLIGSIVVRGPGANQLKSRLIDDLENAVVHEDAPEFQLKIPAHEPTRSTYGVLSSRVLSEKNLRPDRTVVSILSALTNPYDAARALNRLDREDTTRGIRPDELRYGLSHLEPDRIAPDLPPTVGKVVHALIEATGPLSQAALAEKADVSTQSIRNNSDRLTALGIVSKDAQGYRLNLSFRTTQERRNPVTPEFVEAEFLDAVEALLSSILPPERFGDLEDPVGSVLFWPQSPFDLLDDVQLSPWIRLAARLTGTEPPDTETSITMGPEISQTALQEATEVAT